MREVPGLNPRPGLRGALVRSWATIPKVPGSNLSISRSFSLDKKIKPYYLGLLSRITSTQQRCGHVMGTLNPGFPFITIHIMPLRSDVC